MNQPAMWLFENTDATGPLGHAPAYEIMPGQTAAFLLDPDDGAQRVGAFSTHQLWVTPYQADERYASGVYPTAGKGNVVLPRGHGLTGLLKTPILWRGTRQAFIICRERKTGRSCR